MPHVKRMINLAKQMRYQFQEKLGDWRSGIYTADFFLPKDVTKNSEVHPYGAVSYQQFHRLMRRLDLRPGQDVFVDYGSGLGRAVVLAATYPFRKVVGVELSTSLTETAKQNLKTVKLPLKCKNVELHNTDARAFKVPADANILFFCSPFSGSILKKVLDNVWQSVRQHPRQVRVVYAHPPGGDCLNDIISEVPYLTDRKSLDVGNGLQMESYTIDPPAAAAKDVQTAAAQAA